MSAASSHTLFVKVVVLVVANTLVPFVSGSFNLFINDNELRRITGRSFGSNHYFFVENWRLRPDIVTNLNSAFSLSRLKPDSSSYASVLLRWSRSADSKMVYGLSWSVFSITGVYTDVSVSLYDESSQQQVQNAVNFPTTSGGIDLRFRCGGIPSGKTDLPTVVTIEFLVNGKSRLDNTKSAPVVFRLEFHLSCEKDQTDPPTTVTTKLLRPTEPLELPTTTIITKDQVSWNHVPGETTVQEQRGTIRTSVQPKDTWSAFTVAAQTPPSLGPSVTQGISTWILVTGAGIGAVVIILVIISLCIVCRMSRRHSDRKQASTTNVMHVLPNTSACKSPGKENLDICGTGSASSNDSTTFFFGDKFGVDRKDLTLGKILGQGAFGVVHEGTLKGERVAVKRLKEISTSADDTRVAKILEEARHMSDFDHPNVLSLIGVAMGGDGMPQLITSFMGGGDLLTFLRKHSPPGGGGSTKPSLSLETQLDLSLQVAMGMEYLALKNFVHRDLAARNCMLSDNLCVKVGDFGLGRDVQEDSYYRTNTEWCLPVRWMALESLQYHRFSQQTDVWSYGVLLHEIFTCGASPYAGLANIEVMPYLLAGNRLAQPKMCPDNIFELMTTCWLPSSADRPPFSRIVDFLLTHGKAESSSNALRVRLYSNLAVDLPFDDPNAPRCPSPMTSGVTPLEKPKGAPPLPPNQQSMAPSKERSPSSLSTYENTRQEEEKEEQEAFSKKSKQQHQHISLSTDNMAGGKLRTYSNIVNGIHYEEGSVS